MRRVPQGSRMTALALIGIGWLLVAAGFLRWGKRMQEDDDEIRLEDDEYAVFVVIAFAWPIAFVALFVVMFFSGIGGLWPWRSEQS